MMQPGMQMAPGMMMPQPMVQPTNFNMRQQNKKYDSDSDTISSDEEKGPKEKETYEGHGRHTEANEYKN
jgi:hypothetical protein